MDKNYFSEEHNIFRASVRKFVEKNIIPYIEEWEDEEIFPVEMYKKCADAGFLGLQFPEEYGGTPCDKFMFIAFIEEFLRCGSAGLFSGLFSHTIAIPPVLNLGTEEQKQQFLVPVLAGDKIAALGITEPDAGSDVANLRTRAVRDGDYYIVNGAKTFITSGCRANFVTTAVRTGGTGNKGISLLLIDSSTPGFKVAKKIRKMGWHSSDTAELSFEDRRVPAGNIIGREGDGFRGITNNFISERLTLAVEAHTLAGVALEESIKYAKTREAFGTTLNGFQTIRHKLVDMAMRVDIAREYNYRIASLIQKGIDVNKEVSMAKNFACEVCDKVAFDAVQIHGGYGYAREYMVERIYRDSRILSIGGGTTEIMKEIISKIIL